MFSERLWLQLSLFPMFINKKQTQTINHHTEGSQKIKKDVYSSDFQYYITQVLNKCFIKQHFNEHIWDIFSN